VFRPFAAWAGGGEWAVDLPAGEAAVGLATGAAFSAVATSARLIRLFSTAGLQTGCVAVPGDIVAVAAQGAAVAVAWHAWAPAHPADQGLAVTLFDGCTAAAVGPPAAPLPLSPDSTLAWLGFSEEGLLAAYDSAGVMRVRPVGGLAAAAGGGGAGGGVGAAAPPAAAGPAAADAAASHWTPVFDAAIARKGAEVFWPVGLAGDSFHCVVCKADAPEPGERPLVTLEPLRTPALAVGGAGPDADAVVALEDSLLRMGAAAMHWRAASSDAAAGLAPLAAADAARAAVAEADALADRALIRLFHAALKAGSLERALEAASRLAGLKSLEGALKLANALKAPVLAERVAALLTRRMELEGAATADAGGAGAPTPVAPTPVGAYTPTSLATAPSGEAVGLGPGAANPFLRAGRTPLGNVPAENQAAGGVEGGGGGAGDGAAAAAAAAKRKAADAALAAASANPFARGAKAHRA
jgi:chromosome transmission fidelity protein 4